MDVYIGWEGRRRLQMYVNRLFTIRWVRRGWTIVESLSWKRKITVKFENSKSGGPSGRISKAQGQVWYNDCSLRKAYYRKNTGVILILAGYREIIDYLVQVWRGGVRVLTLVDRSGLYSYLIINSFAERYGRSLLRSEVGREHLYGNFKRG